MSDKIVAIPRGGKKRFQEQTWIAVKDLSVVWAQSQRPLNEKHVQSIVENFDPDMFGSLSVTMPDSLGVYHVIDGQHRRAAVEAAYGGNEKVPCHIFDATDPARAAELFDHINSARKNPQPIDLFRVRVTAGNEIENAVNRIVKKCGYVVAYKGSKGCDNNAVTCIAALMSVYKAYGPDVLENTLNLIRAIWGVDQSAATAHIVRGIAEFLAEFRDIDWKRLREAMASKYTPARLLGAAKTAREINGGNVPSSIKRQILLTYNAGIRSKNKKLKSESDFD